MNKKYKGGVLLTTLLFIFLFSFIFALVLEEFQLTQRFTHKTKEYYIAKTMVSMLLFDIKEGQKGLEKKGHQDFSSGKVQYEYDRIRLKFIVQLNQKTYRFQEDYREDEKEKNKLKSKKGE